MNRFEKSAGSAVAEGATDRKIVLRVTAPMTALLHPCLRVSERIKKGGMFWDKEQSYP
jgi:hypothetical protein